MFGESFIKRASAWYLDGTIIKPRITGTNLEYDGGADIAGQLQGALINNQMVSKATFDILGLMTDPRFLNLQCEDPGAGTLYDFSGQGHDGTYQGSMTTSDRIMKANGWALDFDGTDDYVNLGDHDDFSFGNGDNDEAVTFFGVCEVVESTVTQTLISKRDDTAANKQREYSIYIGSDEKLVYISYDESTDVFCFRVTSAALSIGWHTYMITSPGDGGATAMNNVKIYIDGALVASTATNDGAYVAMENLATPVWIGAYENSSGVAADFMIGDDALAGIDGSEWSAYVVHRVHQLCKGLYGL